MPTETVARNVKGALIAFGLVAVVPAATLVLGQEISYRVQMLKKTKGPANAAAFVNVNNQILA